jgi:menaquinol-cytochrome c reductase iron-sulfur subunit
MPEPEHPSAYQPDAQARESPGGIEPMHDPAEELSSRRRLLKWLGFGLTGLAGGLCAVPVLGSILSPILRWKNDEWISLGKLEKFPTGRMMLVSFANPHRVASDGLTGQEAAYVRRDEIDRVVVFSVHCAHLGCPVSWFPQSGLFMCPCHGGVYSSEGKNVSGPPPRGLFRYQHRIENGELMIRAGHLPLLCDPLSPKGAEEDEQA